MPPNEKTQKQLILDTHDTVMQISTVLLGVPGTEDTGLVGEVKNNKDNINVLGKSHGKLKRNFYILIAFLIGSGILGGSIWSMLNG